MDDLNVNVDVEVNSLQEVKELRKELEKIKELIDDIENDGDELEIDIPDREKRRFPDLDPVYPFEPDYPEPEFPKWESDPNIRLEI